MGTFAPFWLAAGMSALSTASGLAQAGQQQKAQRQAQAVQTQQAQAEIAALERQRADAEADRRNRLERTTAAQRAAFAAGGVSSDGSGDAVFGNLLAEADAERGRLNAEINRRIEGLQSGIRLNLLNRAPGPDYLGALTGFGQDVLRSWNRYSPPANPKPRDIP